MSERKRLCDESLEELRQWVSLGEKLPAHDAQVLIDEIDRLRALSVVPDGAVKVRVAVVMTPEGLEWTAIGSSAWSDKEMVDEALGWANDEVPAAFITAYVMPPKPAEVAGVVERAE